MDDDFLLDGLSDSEIASFVPDEQHTQLHAQSAEINFLRSKIEALEWEKYRIASEANSRVAAATNELVSRVSELESKISSLETELQLSVLLQLLYI